MKNAVNNCKHDMPTMVEIDPNEMYCTRYT